MTGLETAQLEQELIERGVNPQLAAVLLSQVSSETVAQTLRWFDAQGGRVGAGVLVAELRSGGRAPTSRTRSPMEEQRAYGEQIVDWLRENFPEWNREEGNRTHTAAIAAVRRLHARVGKGRVTKREHGPEIREAVASFESEYGSPGEGG